MNKLVKLLAVSGIIVVPLVACHSGNAGSATAAPQLTQTEMQNKSVMAAVYTSIESMTGMIIDYGQSPFYFLTTSPSFSDPHQLVFKNTTQDNIIKIEIQVDDPNLKISGLIKSSESSYWSNNYIAPDQTIPFTLTYHGNITAGIQTSSIKVSYYTVNRETGISNKVPGVVTLPIQYQTTNGPAIIKSNISEIDFHGEILANNNDFDSALLELTNDSDTPSGNISFNSSSEIFSVESSDCVALTAHSSCTAKVIIGKTSKVAAYKSYDSITGVASNANLNIKYATAAGNPTARTAQFDIKLAGTTVVADKVYIRLESAVASGRLFAGDGSTKTPYNVEVGGAPLDLQLSYRNTGRLAVENFKINTSKISKAYKVINNGCTNTTLLSNEVCNINLTAATNKVAVESLDLQAMPAIWDNHTESIIPYQSNNAIYVNVHPKSKYLLDTEVEDQQGIIPEDPTQRTTDKHTWRKSRYAYHDQPIRVSVSAENPDANWIDFRIDPKSLPPGMECAGGDDEHNDPCQTSQATLKIAERPELYLMMDRTVPDGIYRIKATAQGRIIYADVMVYGYWTVGSQAPANTVITGLTANNNNVFVTAANSNKIYSNSNVINPKGLHHNWGASKGLSNMSKLSSTTDGNMCLIADGKKLYHATETKNGVKNLAFEYSLTDLISNVACLNGTGKSLASSGKDVYYYNHTTNTPQILASSGNNISALVANTHKAYFADVSSNMYVADNSYQANKAVVHSISQDDITPQGAYYPNYSWLLALSPDQKLYSAQLNGNITNATPATCANGGSMGACASQHWIYGHYYYRTTDNGATWNKDTRLGNSWAVLTPNFLPTEIAVSNQFAWSVTKNSLNGFDAPSLEFSQCGWPEPKLTPWPWETEVDIRDKDRDYNCSYVDTPVPAMGNRTQKYILDLAKAGYGFNHIAYDPTYNMVYYSDSVGNVFGVWAQVPSSQRVPYPGTPTYY